MDAETTTHEDDLDLDPRLKTGPLGTRIELVNNIPPPIAAAIVQAQKFAEAIGKEGWNKHSEYAYGKMEDLIEVGKTALNKAGLALIPSDLTQRRFVVGEKRVTNYDAIRYWMLVHESGCVLNIRVAWPMFLQGGKRARDKAVSAADTTMLGYLYRDLLGIPRLTADQMDARDDTGTTEPGQVEAKPKKKDKPKKKACPEKPYKSRPEAAKVADGLSAAARVFRCAKCMHWHIEPERKEQQVDLPTCSSGKQMHTSKTAAKRANSKNSARIRVYRCDECKRWHVTVDEKNKSKEGKASAKAADKKKAGKKKSKKKDKPQKDVEAEDPTEPEEVPEDKTPEGDPPTEEPTEEPEVEDTGIEEEDGEAGLQEEDHAESTAAPKESKPSSSKKKGKVDASPETKTGKGGTTQRGKTAAGQTYGEKAEEVAEQQRAELTDEELDEEVRKALAAGITPSTTNNTLIVDLPPDPTIDDLEESGWPRELAEELGNFEEAKPVRRKAMNAITRKAGELLGYSKLGKAKPVIISSFEDVGVSVKGSRNSANGYQMRLWALAIAGIASASELAEE